MKKLKTMLEKTSKTLKELFKKFPITLITIIIITLFTTAIVNSDSSILDTAKKVLSFGLIFSIESFFTEVYFKNKKFKIIGYIVSALIAIGFTSIMYSSKISNTLNESTTRILVGFLISLILMSLYKIVKKENLKFNEYIIKIFANIFNSSLIFIILNIGITLLSLIFIELILDGSNGDFIIRMQVLLLGLFYIPAIINSVSNVKDKEISTFIKGLIKYVLLPLVSVGILIIYVYIIKILILREMPSNIIFRILAGIFIVAFPVWNMADNFKDENKIIGRATKILTYLYMPFILLEIYSISVRIFEYGITPIRYLGIMFIILQIIAFILTVIKEKKELNLIFVCSAVLIIISFITPLNYETVSLLNQKSILVKYIKQETNFDTLQDEEKEKASSAYKYIKSNNGEGYIPEYIKNNEIRTKLAGYYVIGTKKSVESNENIYFYEKSGSIDVTGYSKIINVYQNSKDNFNQVEFANKNNDYIVTVNLEEFIKDVIEESKTKKDIDEYMNNNKYVKVDETRSLYIENLDIMYNSYIDEINSIYISGYILER